MIRLCAFADESGESLDTQIAALHRNGITLVELRSVNGKNVADLTDEEASSCQKTLEENGIAVWSVGSPLGKVKLSEAAEHMEKVRRVCRIAQLLKTDKIRMFSFFESYGDPAAVKQYLSEMTAIAKEYGVCLYHENEKEVYGDTLARVVELTEAGIKGLRFVFDPANFLQCGERVREALDTLFDKIDYLHIKDVIVETGELVPAGHGDGAIDYILDRIAASGRDTVLTLEPHLKVFSGYGSIDNTVLQTKFSFASNEESFDAAANALKAVLSSCGYKETEKGAFAK